VTGIPGTGGLGGIGGASGLFEETGSGAGSGPTGSPSFVGAIEGDLQGVVNAGVGGIGGIFHGVVSGVGGVVHGFVGDVQHAVVGVFSSAQHTLLNDFGLGFQLCGSGESCRATAVLAVPVQPQAGMSAAPAVGRRSSPHR
jgi:hypothetical protein